MKRYLLGIFAIVIAIAAFAFSVENKSRKTMTKAENLPAVADPLYYQYEAGEQDDPNSYAEPTTNKPAPCPFSTNLCWFRVDDIVAPIGVIDHLDFQARFNALDTNNDGVINSMDAVTEDDNILSLKN